MVNGGAVDWFPAVKVVDRFDPKAEGKFVEFKTLYRRSEMRGTRSFTSIIDWPYREGLRMDEAMNPLTLMTVGLYGKTLPKGGAPLRLIVPWKYGFKNIKSIVEKYQCDRSPAQDELAELAPQEYGFTRT